MPPVEDDKARRAMINPGRARVARVVLSAAGLLALAFCVVAVSARCGGPGLEFHNEPSTATSLIQTFSFALRREYLVTGRLPERIDGLQSEDNFVGFSKEPGSNMPRDGWGNPLIYRVHGPTTFELRSCGADGVADSKDDIVERRDVERDEAVREGW